ncbi:MAG: ribbon-helix-helix protein, CopG family [Nitrospirae bacterium]|nr:ribbon-helix-helix protein, CopG family [Nitrospirota bacterium]
MAKVMISLPDTFLARVDRKARAEDRSRSEVIREALRAFLGGAPPDRPSWKEALRPLRELEDRWIGEWDSTQVIRYFRETRHGRADRR